MTKRIFLITLIFALFVPVQMTSSFSATKAGAKCTKVGIKSVVGNKTFTCIKSGKKLVWNKGVAIKPTPAPTPTLTEAKPILVESNWQTLYRKTLNSLKQQSIENLQIEAVYSPTVSKNTSDTVLQEFKSALTFYASRFGKDKKIYIFFMSEQDKSWWESKVKEYEGSSVSHDWWGKCRVDAMRNCGMGTNSVSTNIFYHIVGSKWTPNVTSKVNVFHETVHMYQKSIIGDGMYRLIPPWFGEGQANFLGFVTSSQFTNVSDWRSGQIKQLDRGFPNYLQFKSNDWLDAINKTDGNIDFCVKNGLGYTLGMLISEYLYLKFSPDQIDSVLHDVTKGTSWDSAISSNLGVAKSQLYKDASEYVYLEVQETLAK
jgi:hypothetical protein